MSVRRTIVRTVTAIVGVVALAAVAGIAYQEFGSRADERTLLPPGKMVEVDGFRMHLNCAGEGHPTVILEAGATGFSSTWAWVHSALAQSTRVCSYDRAGMGWSDVSPRSRDGLTMARELRTLLRNAGEQGPYIVVGHSLGGILARIFAEEYENEIAGVVLVDSSHPDQLERFPPEFVDDFHSFVSMLGYSPIAARLGILRATNMIGASAAGLPEREYRAAVYFGSSPKHLRASHAELEMWDETMRQARANRSLGDLPLLVLSASIMPGAPEGVVPINHEMHRELSKLSSRGTHDVVLGSDHFSILMQREYGQSVAEVILREMPMNDLSAVRSSA